MATASRQASDISRSDSGRSEFVMDRAIACVIFRMAIGLDILLHGVTRVFIGNLGTFVANTMKQFESTVLPPWQVQSFATVVPFAEIIVGVMLLLGVGIRWGIIAGSLLMIALEFGTALRSDWNLLWLQMSYSLMYAAMLFCREWDTLSVMNLFGLRSKQ